MRSERHVEASGASNDVKLVVFAVGSHQAVLREPHQLIGYDGHVWKIVSAEMQAESEDRSSRSFVRASRYPSPG